MEIFGIKLFQIIVLIFAIFAFTRVMMQRKQKNFSLNEYLLWGSIWVGIVVLSFSGPLLQKTAELVGIVSGANLLIYTSITLIFYIVYRLYAKVDQQQQEITSLVTKIAINNVKKKK